MSKLSDKNLTASSGPKSTVSEPQLDSAPEVETTLSLIGASDEGRAARQAHSGKRQRILLAVGAVIVLAGLGAFLARNWLRPTPGAPAAASAFPLQLEVTQEDSGLINVRWNASSAPALQAREGRLVINEGNQQPRIVPLGADQLRIGHLSTQSGAQHLEVRLEVDDPSGAITKESVLVLSSRLQPAARPPEAAPQAGHEQAQATKAQSMPNVEGNAPSPQVATAPEPVQPSRSAPRTFTPPPSPTNRDAGRTILLEPPTPLASASAAPTSPSLPDTVSRLSAPQLPPAQVRAAPVKQIRVGGNLQSANLIKKVAPNYPPLAKAARVQGSVRFTATIGKDGTIQNLQLVNGPPMLVQAASDAVKQWVYRPTLLNGEPVEVVTQIELNFSLSH